MAEFDDNTKCADELDAAAAITEAFTQESISKVQAMLKPEQVKNEDGTWPVTECVDCDQELPEGRLELGKVRCVHCQGLLEKRRAGHVGTARIA